MRAMRLLFPLSLAGLALALACSAYSGGVPPGSADPGDEPGRQVERNIPFQTVAQASVPGGVGGPVREVIESEGDWLTVWQELGAAGGPPRVDFSRDMVILVAMETQSCVSKITVQSIKQGADSLLVDVLEQPPGPTCVCITSERPYHAVRLQRTDLPVHYEAQRSPSDC